jgi:hypothetical protein
MIAGIDVGQRKIVIAYKSSPEIPIFERIYKKMIEALQYLFVKN